MAYQLEDQSDYAIFKTLRSEAGMGLVVPSHAVPDIYDFDSLILISAGAQEFRCNADELGGTADLSFELVEEPTEKPNFQGLTHRRQ